MVAVDVALEFVDALGVHVEGDDLLDTAEKNRYGHSDIAQTHDRDLTILAHPLFLSKSQCIIP